MFFLLLSFLFWLLFIFKITLPLSFSHPLFLYLLCYLILSFSVILIFLSLLSYSFSLCYLILSFSVILFFLSLLSYSFFRCYLILSSLLSYSFFLCYLILSFSIILFFLSYVFFLSVLKSKYFLLSHIFSYIFCSAFYQENINGSLQIVGRTKLYWLYCKYIQQGTVYWDPGLFTCYALLLH